ncbi:InlB B-repeat-containing protein [Faecalibacterium taiwanense]|uniref:InlB B-repeat-containing protein n=1 Tax=Faecalibacterium taiwanense TaxID=3030638 RepID=UPI00321A9C41
MRKKSTRLLSAALAACMMLSVLPVGAFAAEPGAAEPENGVSAQEETEPYHLNGGETVNDTFVAAHGDVYELSGPYTKSITVYTTKNVTLNIVGNVDVNMGSALLNVKDARDLKINAGQYDVVANVKNTDAAAFMNLNASNATVVVQNGRYLDGEQRLSFFTVVAGTLELNDVYIAAKKTTFPILNGSVVHINGGELTAEGYYIVYNAPWPWAGIEKAGTVIIDGAKIKNGFVGSKNGSVEIKNSTLKNDDGYCVSIEGGTITLDNVNVSARGEESHNSRVLDLCGKLYDDTAQEIRITNGGTYEALASGMTVVFGGGLNADVTLDNITIKNGKYGVHCLVDKKHELVIKNVTFEGNDTDIYLSSGEDSEEFGNPYVTIDPTFTSEAKIEVRNPYEGRRITTYTNGKAYQKNLKLTSANSGYVIGYKNDYRGEYRYLTRGYYVDSEKAVATAEINGELNQLDSTKLIAKDTEVTLKAADTAPEGKEFKGWKLYKVVNGTETEITDKTELANLLKNGTETTATLTMPAYNVKAEPYYSDIPYNITAVDCTVDMPKASMGDTVTATRRALKANERFIGWTVKVNGVKQHTDDFLTPDANDPAKVRFTMPAENVEIKANFEGNPTLNIGDHVTANIDGSDASVPSGSTVPVGETVHLTAIAPDGQHFTGWTVKVGGEEQKADTFLTTPNANDPTKVTFTMPSENVEVTANFASNPTLNPTLRVGDHVTATIEGSDASVPSGSTVPVPKNKIVHLTATAPGQHFISWTVKVNGVEQDPTFLKPDADDPTKVTFIMPDANVEVTATFADDPIGPDGPDPVGPSDTGNIQGAISAVVVGAAAGAIIYEAGTGIYRVINMPGIPMPSNRIELAELLWEHAGKPEPVSTALYSDIDEGDTDAQKAARWAVEQDLMKDDADNNKFNPYFPVSKLRTCLTWNAAKEKGLFDKTEE